MKKLWGQLGMCLVLIAFCGSLSGCKSLSREGEKSDMAKEKIVITLCSGLAEETMNRVLNNFHQAQDEIRVNYIQYMNDDDGNIKLDTALLSGAEIDLFASYHLYRLSMRARYGAALDLTDLFVKAGYDIYKDVGNLAAGALVDGKPFAVVNSVQPKCYIVNKNAFDEAGIPIPKEWTIEEYREIAARLTKGEGQNKQYGTFVFNDDWDKWLNPVKTKYGGDFLWNSDGTSGFDKPEVKTALQLYYDMSLVDGSMPTLMDTITKKLHPRDMFLTEKAAMVDSQWIFRNVKDIDAYPHDFVAAFIPFPKMEKDQKDYYCPGGAGDLMSISAKSPHKEAALKFLLYYQTEGMLSISKFGRIPASSAISDEDVEKAMLEGAENLFDLESFREVFLGARFDKYALQTETKAAPEIAKIVKEEGDKALTGIISVDEAIKNMKEQADEKLAKAK